MIKFESTKSVKKELGEHLCRLEQIAYAKYENLDHIGVLSGRSGVALFEFYCAKFFDDDSFANKGVDIIESCIDMINQGYSHPTYCTGIAGLGWTLQHLVDHNFIDLDLPSLLGPFDHYLDAQMTMDLDYGNFDFLHGALGYGFYFLKCFQGSNNQYIRKKYKGYLNKLVDGLMEMGIKKGKHIKWESILDHEKGNKGCNLSLSHGISSIIFFLSQLHAEGIRKKAVEKSILGATNYLLYHKSQQQSSLSLFPSWVETGVNPNYNSRLAWCYGDIGIGLSLMRAGEVLKNANFYQNSFEVLNHCSKRKSEEQTKVIDAGICHGSFGNAHIFNGLSKRNGWQSLQEAAIFWFKDGLQKYSGNVDEPFKQWNGQEKTMNMELDLLGGISGIGLCIIDFLSPNKNTWDECLMLR